MRSGPVVRPCHWSAVCRAVCAQVAQAKPAHETAEAADLQQDPLPVITRTKLTPKVR